MIYVDTGAWFACFVSRDARHEQATVWYRSNHERLITTDYVLAELFTLLKARGQFRTAIEIGDALWAGELAQVEYTATKDIAQAWMIYKSYEDKKWSYTDCISRVVIERLGLTQASAFDEHFRQFGTVTIVP